ncbi:OB-fold domain-containing protein [Aquihabitans sp. G128]|uniref:Zn-ribbon domain-containing OB-fold protein n=1 Tax=Aquihabitans sp. G128 TaxID=2849779 RepID=UPI001C2259F4|nr:OB-fold domain-containing protein [Aquihabitans sp. G128]QXC62913.1 OB-fold domain-containing protein [Aquihabitans sp. G128]
MTEQDAGAILSAPLIIEYPFKRTTGPVIGAFLTGLREQVLVGSKAADGRVIVPPAEFDPVSGEDLTELVEVGPAGEITTWAWVTHPHEKHPLDQPFAWALIKPDGADTPMLGAVAADGIDALATGARVTPVWAEEREGHINDLTHWVLEAEGGAA